MKLALKIDVTTLRGTREGVPAIIDVLERHGAGATFLLSLGPDRGRALLPRADIGHRARDVLRAVGSAGFETGILSHDVRAWIRDAAAADADWTAAQMQRALDSYGEVFGEPPRVHGAAGWQMNRHALRLTQRLGFHCCSDGRGHGPHLPVWNAELVRCPQFPTTLPTLDEVLGAGADASARVDALLSRTAEIQADEVFTLRAGAHELGLAAFETLLVGWKAQGFALVSLGSLLESVEPMALPRCEVGLAAIAERTDPVFVQGEEFLADALPRAA